MTALERALVLRLLREGIDPLKLELRRLGDLVQNATIAQEKLVVETDLALLSSLIRKLWQGMEQMPNHGTVTDLEQIAVERRMPALEAAIELYRVISSQPGEVALAAFGLACADIIDTLGISLRMAAVLLHNELAKRKIP